MIKVGIILSHRSTSLEHYPKAMRDALSTTIGKYNHNNGDRASVEVALDYEGFQDLKKTLQSQESIKQSMLDLRSKYDEMIFLLLIDGMFGEGMKNEYHYIREADKGLSPKKKFHIHALIKKRPDYSDVSYPELMDKSDETTPVCDWYEDGTFDGLAYQMLDTVVGKGIKRKRKKWIRFFLAFIAAVLGALFLYNAIKNKETVPSGSSQVEFKERIMNVRDRIDQGLFDAALDSLDVLGRECPVEWPNEKNAIDSLKTVALDGKALDEQARAALGERIAEVEAMVAGAKYDKDRVLNMLSAIERDCKPGWTGEKKRIDDIRRRLPPSREPGYRKNGCRIVSSDSVISTTLISKLNAASLGLDFSDAGQVEWRITVEERLRVSPKQYQNVTTYSATSTLTARILRNGKEDAVEPVVGNAVSTLGEEQAGDEARKKALDILAGKLIEKIRK